MLIWQWLWPVLLSPCVWRSSITAVRGRSLRRGKRRNQTLPPCRHPAPWLCPLPLRLRRRSTTATNQRPTPPPSSLRPTGLPATPPHRHHAGASAHTPSARPAPAAHCPSTCSTQRGCATAVAGSATGLCSSRTWNCPWTWPASTRSSTSSAPLPWGRWSPTVSALTSRCRQGAGRLIYTSNTDSVMSANTLNYYDI